MDPVLAFRADDRIAANTFKANAQGYLSVLCSLLDITIFGLSGVNSQPFVFHDPLLSCVLALKIYKTLSNKGHVIRVQELPGETDSEIPREGFHHYDE